MEGDFGVLCGDFNTTLDPRINISDTTLIPIRDVGGIHPGVVGYLHP